MVNTIIYIAHRGDCTRLPENSIAAFRKAFRNDWDGVEFDVRKSRDGKLYLLHDARLGRTTSMSGYISRKTSEELKECRLRNGERLPLLEDLLKIFPKGKIAMLEIKVNGIERQVLRLLQKYGLKKKTIICSFKSDILRKVRRLDKGIRLDLERPVFFSPQARLALRLGCTTIGFKRIFLRKRQVDLLHMNGVLLVPYAIESKMQRMRLIRKGADGFCVKKRHPS